VEKNGEPADPYKNPNTPTMASRMLYLSSSAVSP
jgi:hypothetical protein